MNKAEFVHHEAEDVHELYRSFKVHRDAIEEELKQQPDDDALRDAFEDCDDAIKAIEPIMVDYDREGVDAEELAKYAETLTEWHEREGEIAELLKK